MASTTWNSVSRNQSNTVEDRKYTPDALAFSHFHNDSIIHPANGGSLQFNSGFINNSGTVVPQNFGIGEFSSHAIATNKSELSASFRINSDRQKEPFKLWLKADWWAQSYEQDIRRFDVEFDVEWESLMSVDMIIYEIGLIPGDGETETPPSTGVIATAGALSWSKEDAKVPDQGRDEEIIELNTTPEYLLKIRVENTVEAKAETDRGAGSPPHGTAQAFTTLIPNFVCWAHLVS